MEKMIISDSEKDRIFAFETLQEMEKLLKARDQEIYGLKNALFSIEEAARKALI